MGQGAREENPTLLCPDSWAGGWCVLKGGAGGEGRIRCLLFCTPLENMFAGSPVVAVALFSIP